jgi:hypothetical protein
LNRIGAVETPSAELIVALSDLNAIDQYLLSCMLLCADTQGTDFVSISWNLWGCRRIPEEKTGKKKPGIHLIQAS